MHSVCIYTVIIRSRNFAYVATQSLAVRICIISQIYQKKIKRSSPKFWANFRQYLNDISTLDFIFLANILKINKDDIYGY